MKTMNNDVNMRERDWHINMRRKPESVVIGLCYTQVSNIVHNWEFGLANVVVNVVIDSLADTMCMTLHLAGDNVSCQ